MYYSKDSYLLIHFIQHPYGDRYYSHFTDVETEVQKSSITQYHTASKRQSQGYNQIAWLVFDQYPENRKDGAGQGWRVPAWCQGHGPDSSTVVPFTPLL